MKRERKLLWIAKVMRALTVPLLCSLAILKCFQMSSPGLYRIQVQCPAKIKNMFLNDD